jgi:hypothetical protein
MAFVTHLLSRLADAMLLPCVALLFALAAWVLFDLGRFLRELLQRRSTRARAPLGLVTEADSPRGRSRAFQCAVATEAGTWTLADLERVLSGPVDRGLLVARLAPMLGLAGTLIPLGPGLRAMAEGRPEGLAENLVVAFTTTVVGLASSALALTVSHIRTRWYETDLAAFALWDDAGRSNPSGSSNA